MQAVVNRKKTDAMKVISEKMLNASAWRMNGISF